MTTVRALRVTSSAASAPPSSASKVGVFIAGNLVPTPSFTPGDKYDCWPVKSFVLDDGNRLDPAKFNTINHYPSVANELWNNDLDTHFITKEGAYGFSALRLKKLLRKRLRSTGKSSSSNALREKVDALSSSTDSNDGTTKNKKKMLAYILTGATEDQRLTWLLGLKDGERQEQWMVDDLLDRVVRLNLTENDTRKNWLRGLSRFGSPADDDDQSMLPLLHQAASYFMAATEGKYTDEVEMRFRGELASSSITFKTSKGHLLPYRMTMEMVAGGHADNSEDVENNKKNAPIISPFAKWTLYELGYGCNRQTRWQKMETEATSSPSRVIHDVGYASIANFRNGMRNSFSRMSEVPAEVRRWAAENKQLVKMGKMQELETLRMTPYPLFEPLPPTGGSCASSIESDGGTPSFAVGGDSAGFGSPLFWGYHTHLLGMLKALHGGQEFHSNQLTISEVPRFPLFKKVVNKATKAEAYVFNDVQSGWNIGLWHHQDRGRDYVFSMAKIGEISVFHWVRLDDATVCDFKEAISHAKKSNSNAIYVEPVIAGDDEQIKWEFFAIGHEKKLLKV